MKKLIIFGRGEVGVRSTEASIFLSKLPTPLSIGQLTKKGEALVEIRFENLDSLNIMLNALRRCKTNLELQESIPLELRFSA